MSLRHVKPDSQRSVLIVNSADRKTNDTRSNFTVRNSRLGRIRSMKLVRVHYTNYAYNIVTGKTDELKFERSGPVVDTLTLSAGFYNISDIGTALTAALPNYSLVEDLKTGLVTITNGTNNFKVLTGNLATKLGFPSTSASYAASQVAPNTVDLALPDAYISLKSLANDGTYTSLDDSKSDIIHTLPLSANSFGSRVSYEPIHTFEYVSPKTQGEQINRLEFTLTDYAGDAVDLNADFTLEFYIQH